MRKANKLYCNRKHIVMYVGSVELELDCGSWKLKGQLGNIYTRIHKQFHN